MPDPEWPCSPPEANYLRLVGPGAAGTATTLASAAAWQALMGSNELAFALSELNIAMTALDFEGVGGLSSSTAATGLNTALQLLAAWAQEKPPIAASAVSAYQTAVSSMIPAEVCLANRAEQAADVAMNPLVFGALTPAIVALDAEYFGEHWPHNASAGAAYGAALAGLVAALAIPPPPSPPGASPAAPAAAAGALAESIGQVTAAEAVNQTGPAIRNAGEIPGEVAGVPPAAAGQIGQFGSLLAQPMQAAMGALAPMAGMFQAPAQTIGGLSGLLPSMSARRDGTLGEDDGSHGDEFGFPVEEFAGPGTAEPGIGGRAIGIGGTGAGAVSGSGAAAVGGLRAAGITSYIRPQGAFEPPNSGRPVGMKAGLLSTATELQGPVSTATELQGPVSTVPGGGMAPSPAQPGIGKREPGEKGAVTQARIVLNVPGSAQG